MSGTQPRVLLPFARFARERLVLLLIALATFSVVQLPNTQDKTRLSLTQAILEHGDLTIERYGVQVDRAKHGRHLYTDKAPGLSLVALPAVAVVRLAERVSGRARAPLIWSSNGKLGFVRLMVLAPFLLLLAWLVGRTAEGLVAGSGAAAAVTTALGTMLGPLSTVLFAHVAEACLGFAAFVVLARARDPRSAAVGGALAGTAVLMDYEGALLAAALGLYVAIRRRPVGVGAYLLGAVPPAVVLGAYDTVAFGSPLRLSYHYKAGPNATDTTAGLFGIGRPQLDHLVTTLAGERGLLRVSPVLALAAAGLALLWRRGFRAEAALATAVGLLYLVLESGYFDTYGGISPGPRFFAPAVPFLLLGFASAFAAAPRLVAALLVVSVGISVWDNLTWFRVERGAWPKTVASLAGAPRSAGIVLAALVAAAAVAVSLERPLVAATRRQAPFIGSK
jgi:hypothetical protein